MAILLFLSCINLIAVMPATGEDTGEPVEKPVRDSIETRQATQKEEAKWRAEREKKTALLDKLRQEQEQLLGRREELQKQASSIRARVAAREKQLKDIEQISHQIRPFLDELVDELGSLLEEGPRFLTEERSDRIERLKEIMSDTEISMSEKYRKVMEAMLIEAEYGFSIETYQETITVKGENILADIFRMGRVALFYQTMDQKTCGFYDVAAQGWQELPSSHRRQIRSAIEIAAKQKPAEMLSLPLGRMVIQ